MAHTHHAGKRRQGRWEKNTNHQSEGGSLGFRVLGFRVWETSESIRFNGEKKQKTLSPSLHPAADVSR